jgi:hypothetical protein
MLLVGNSIAELHEDGENKMEDECSYGSPISGGKRPWDASRRRRKISRDLHGKIDDRRLSLS